MADNDSTNEKARRKYVGFWVTVNEIKAYDGAARKERRSRSDWMRLALEDALRSSGIWPHDEEVKSVER